MTGVGPFKPASTRASCSCGAVDEDPLKLVKALSGSWHAFGGPKEELNDDVCGSRPDIKPVEGADEGPGEDAGPRPGVLAPPTPLAVAAPS